MATLPPLEGYEILSPDDVNERVQRGDMVWDETDLEWMKASGVEIGDWVYGFHGVARPIPVPPVKIETQPTTLRVARRTRRP